MNWHARFCQQAQWTRPLRAHLFARLGVTAAARVLEVGCGTGALLEDFPSERQGALHGLDINRAALQEAARHAPDVALLCADGHSLPYARACFDLVFCHYFLLWTRDPLRVLTEMRRVTRPGGVVLALAEPDYGGRVDYPPELEAAGRLQAESLRAQGADPNMGRKLTGLFVRAGLRQVEAGILGGEWRVPAPEPDGLEWEILQSDLSAFLSAGELNALQQREREAHRRGERILFVPTFFACGRV